MVEKYGHHNSEFFPMNTMSGGPNGVTIGSSNGRSE